MVIPAYCSIEAGFGFEALCQVCTSHGGPVGCQKMAGDGTEQKVAASMEWLAFSCCFHEPLGVTWCNCNSCGISVAWNVFEKAFGKFFSASLPCVVGCIRWQIADHFLQPHPLTTCHRLSLRQIVFAKSQLVSAIFEGKEGITCPKCHFALNNVCAMPKAQVVREIRRIPTDTVPENLAVRSLLWALGQSQEMDPLNEPREVVSSGDENYHCNIIIVVVIVVRMMDHHWNLVYDGCTAQNYQPPVNAYTVVHSSTKNDPSQSIKYVLLQLIWHDTNLYCGIRY